MFRLRDSNKATACQLTLANTTNNCLRNYMCADDSLLLAKQVFSLCFLHWLKAFVSMHFLHIFIQHLFNMLGLSCKIMLVRSAWTL